VILDGKKFRGSSGINRGEKKKIKTMLGGRKNRGKAANIGRRNVTEGVKGGRNACSTEKKVSKRLAGAALVCEWVMGGKKGIKCVWRGKVFRREQGNLSLLRKSLLKKAKGKGTDWP